MSFVRFLPQSLQCNCSITVITPLAPIHVPLHDILTLFVIHLIIAIGFKLCKEFRVGIRLDEAS